MSPTGQWVADNKELVQSLGFLLGILIASGCAWLWFTIRKIWRHISTRRRVFFSRRQSGRRRE